MATLTELSLLLAVLFLGTNPVAVKVAAVPATLSYTPQRLSADCGSEGRGRFSDGKIEGILNVLTYSVNTPD